MSDHNERACTKCGSLTHHEDDCGLRTTPEPTAPTETPEEGNDAELSVQEALNYADSGDRHTSDPLAVLAAEVRRLRAPAAAPQPSAEVEEAIENLANFSKWIDSGPQDSEYEVSREGLAKLSVSLRVVLHFASRVRQTATAPALGGDDKMLDHTGVHPNPRDLTSPPVTSEPSPVAQPSNDAAERAAECDVLSGKLVRLGTFLIGHEGNLEEVTGYFVASPREEIEALRYVPTFGRVRIVPESAETSSTPAAPLPKDVAEAVETAKRMVDRTRSLTEDIVFEHAVHTILAALQSGGGDRDRLDAMLGMANAALTRLRAVVDAADRMEEPVRQLMVWATVACGFGVASDAEKKEAFDLIRKITDQQTAYRAAKEKQTP